MLTGLVAGGAAYLGLLGAFALKSASAATEFERFTATIGGGIGSLDRGKEVMSALEQYAQRSAFGLQDLARASTQMVASGLDLAQVLPIAERFALIIGGTDPQGLMEVAGALARVKGGSFGEAMEIFRRAGVSSNDLRAQGIDITKGGEIRGTPTQVMAAIERISQGRPKAMADAVGGTSAVAVSNTLDAVDAAFRKVGESIMQAATPALVSFSNSLNELVKGGAFDGVAAGFKSLIDVIGGVDGSKGLSYAIGALTTSVQGLAWWADQFKGKSKEETENMSWLEKAFNWLKRGGVIGNAVLDRLDNEATIAENARPFSKELQDRIGLRQSTGGLPHTTDKPTETSGGSKTIAYLAQIAENTKLTKQDLRRLAFGAGASEAGVTAVEMSRAKRRRSSGDLGGEIGNLIEDYFNQQFHAWIKQQGYAR